MMKSKLSIKRRVILVGIFFGLSAFGFNCERNHFDVAAQNDGLGSFASLDDGGALVNLPFSMMSGEQLFKSYMSVTGQTIITPAISSEYGKRMDSFATDPELGVLNSPMLLAATSLGAEVCNQFIQLEQNKSAADRSYLGSINFGGPIAAVSQLQYDQVTANLAQSFLSRDLTDNEKDIFHTFRADFLATVPSGEEARPSHTRALVLATCSAFLASFDVFTY